MQRIRYTRCGSCFTSGIPAADWVNEAVVNAFSRDYRTIAATAPAVAVAGNVAGLAASYHFEVPPGAAIIFTLTLTLIVVKLLTLYRKKTRPAA